MQREHGITLALVLLLSSLPLGTGAAQSEDAIDCDSALVRLNDDQCVAVDQCIQGLRMCEHPVEIEVTVTDPDAQIAASASPSDRRCLADLTLQLAGTPATDGCQPLPATRTRGESTLGYLPDSAEAYNLTTTYGDATSLSVRLVENDTRVRFDAHLPFRIGPVGVSDQHNVALLFDAGDDGRADFQVTYHASHAADGDDWSYQTVRSDDETQWTTEDPPPLPESFETTLGPDEQDVTISFPIERLGGTGSSYRVLLFGVDAAAAGSPGCETIFTSYPETIDPFDRLGPAHGVILDSWTSSENYRRATVGDGFLPITPAEDLARRPSQAVPRTQGNPC